MKQQNPVSMMTGENDYLFPGKGGITAGKEKLATGKRHIYTLNEKEKMYIVSFLKHCIKEQFYDIITLDKSKKYTEELCKDIIVS